MSPLRQWAVFAGLCLIALAVLFTQRWQVIAGPYQGPVPTFYRVDRWTGALTVCALDPDTMVNPNSTFSAKMICHPK